jgi:mitochondrial FAD-linked sulfhydryl oxidase
MSQETSTDTPPATTTGTSRTAPDTPVLDEVHFCSSVNESNNICNTQWVQLYSTAAYFPDSPTDLHKQVYKEYFDNFTDQCKDAKIGGCIDRAKEIIPYRSEFNRDEMMLWVCNLEQICRREGGFPTTQCRASKLMKRWGYPDGYL